MTDQPPRELGTVRSYSDLHNLMRARAVEIGISREILDDISGVQAGFSGKLLSPKPMRRMGDMSFAAMLPALGIKLLAVEDEEALAATLGHSKFKQRNEKASIHAATVEFKFSRRWMRKIQRKGGRNSRKYMTKERATEIAVHANRVRWDAVRARRAGHAR